MSDSAQSLWPQAGYAQLKTDARGHLTVTDDFLRVLLLRPELAPIESSCAHEIQIHERLIENTVITSFYNTDPWRRHRLENWQG